MGDGTAAGERELSVEEVRDRYRGALLGLAVGDALGASVEFSPPGSFPPVTALRGGGPFDLAPGRWTDDASMALCLAESLDGCAGSYPEDQMGRYLRWYREGYRSSTGRCFDIGTLTRAALERFERTGDPMQGTDDPRGAGNGSLMRLAPVPMAFLRASPATLLRAGVQASRTTHGNAEAVDACLYLAGLLAGALLGAGKGLLLSPRWFPVEGTWERIRLVPSVDAVAAGSYAGKAAGDLPAGGYVVETLEAALWAFRGAATFADGALAAVNLGNDADTTGAVYGQLAGAYHGMAGIPQEWLDGLHDRDGIVALADRLFDRSGVEGAARRGRLSLHGWRTWDAGGGDDSFGEMRRRRAGGIDRLLAVRHDPREDWGAPIPLRKR